MVFANLLVQLVALEVRSVSLYVAMEIVKHVLCPEIFVLLHVIVLDLQLAA